MNNAAISGSGLLDGFSWYVAVFVLVLTALDWYIGKSGRERIRECVGYWWLYVGQRPITGLGPKNAAAVRKFLLNIFGARAISFRRLVSVAVYTSTLLTCITIYIYRDILPVNAPHPSETIGTVMFLLQQSKWAFGIGLPTEYIALSTVLLLLGILETRRNIVVNIAVAFAALTMWCLLVFVNIVVIKSMDPVLHVTGALHDRALEIAFVNVMNGFVEGAVTTGILLPTIGFSMFFFTFSCLVIVSRLLRPVVQRPLETLLLRFYESDKGILTMLALGIGALAEIVHKAI